MKPSICFVALNAYGVLAGKNTGHIGGIEVQVPMMAKWFARLGYRVSIVTWNDGATAGESIDGVEVQPICARDDGLPGLRFLWPRWTSLHRALDRADADVIYYNCGDMGLGQVALWARWEKRRILYSVSSDVDCYRSLPHLKPVRERVLYRFGLRQADAIVTQTQTQQSLLRQEFGLRSTVISMPSVGFSPPVSLEKKLRTQPFRVLWAGRINPEKRLEMLLDLAELNPDVSFDVLGEANVASNYARQLVKRGNAIPNVTLHGRVQHEYMGGVLLDAHLVCSTSVFEGFPNIYLEAWSAGVPVISTFDPDGIIASRGLGRVASNLEELHASLAELRDESAWLDTAAAVRRHFLENHSLDGVMPQFEEQIRRLTRPGC